MPKDAKGKLRYGLVPWQVYEMIAKVYDYGATKYGVDDWKECVVKNPEIYESAIMRHLQSYRSGEWIDPESGLPHLAHIIGGASMMMHRDLNNDLEMSAKTESFTDKWTIMNAETSCIETNVKPAPFDHTPKREPMAGDKVRIVKSYTPKIYDIGDKFTLVKRCENSQLIWITDSYLLHESEFEVINESERTE
jgi:hypothetical protein